MFSSQNSLKDVVPSCKTAIDLWYCFGKVKKVELFGCLEYSGGGEPRLIAEENAIVLNH